MALSVLHWEGDGEDGTDATSLEDLYDELRVADREHGEVSVMSDDLGWYISAHRDGRLVLDREGPPDARHMIPVSREATLDAWRRLVAGEIDYLLTLPWKPGYV